MIKDLDILGLVRSKGFELDDTKGHVNIVGVRNLTGRVNYFDDKIGVIKKGVDQWHELFWAGDTRPGTPSLLKPVNEHGAAILVPGQYRDAYKEGWYKGYKAVKQVGPVKVYRDNNFDGTWDVDSLSIEEGLFGIHIHKAGIWSQLVGSYSAGCQVIQRALDYKEFMGWIYMAQNFGQKLFTYTLIEA